MDPMVERRLKAIDKAAPTLYETGRGLFTIALAEGNGADGHIKGRGASLELIQVAEELQGHGIGGRLLRTFFRHCAGIDGVEYVESGVISARAMRLCGKTVGEAALHFIEEIDGYEVELPLSSEQAVASLERIQKIWQASNEEEQDALDPGLKLRIYLAEVDTSAWELPILSKQ